MWPTHELNCNVSDRETRAELVLWCVEFVSLLLLFLLDIFLLWRDYTKFTIHLLIFSFSDSFAFFVLHHRKSWKLYSVEVEVDVYIYSGIFTAVNFMIRLLIYYAVCYFKTTICLSRSRSLCVCVEILWSGAERVLWLLQKFTVEKDFGESWTTIMFKNDYNWINMVKNKRSEFNRCLTVCCVYLLVTRQNVQQRTLAGTTWSNKKQRREKQIQSEIKRFIHIWSLICIDTYLDPW